ncbi:MAG: alpha/beta fold hydrolase [Nocardioides sp.]|nr:alpha/beta fold hydrolase [Nocardioides sp.]
MKILVVAGVLTGLAALVATALWSGQRTLVYFPDATDVPPTEELLPDLPGARDVVLRTSDDLDLRASYVPAGPECEVTVLLTPGNGGNRAGRTALVRGLAEQGLGVLAVDYRGYGGNPGSPSEAGTRRDARAAYAFLTRDEGIAPARLLYFGESLGGAVAADLAAEHPPGAVLLRSPFTSLAAMARAVYGAPTGPLLRDEYVVTDAVGRFGAAAPGTPFTVVLGDADAIVPATQSREVAAAGRDAGLDVDEVVLPGADHNEPVLVHGPEVLDAAAALADRIGGDCS